MTINQTRGRHLLADWRVRSRLNQKELAAQLGITDSYLSQILSGMRRPKLEILVRIEQVTGVPVESWADILPSDADTSDGEAANGAVSRGAK